VLGHGSLLADPRDAANLERLNDVKGRERFRPVAPTMLEDRAAGIFSGGRLPSPDTVSSPARPKRIPAVVHVDDSAGRARLPGGRRSGLG
jgi:carbamoyltransferase